MHISFALIFINKYSVSSTHPQEISALTFPLKLGNLTLVIQVSKTLALTNEPHESMIHSKQAPIQCSMFIF